MATVRTAFIMEQTLGHVTHYRNLREVIARQDVVLPTWLPIPFDVRGPERLVPLLRSNWSVRASWRARLALRAAMAHQALDALFFHTQVTSLFSCSMMRRVPSVVSLDATPVNYDSVGHHYQHRAAGNGLIDRRKHEMNRQAFECAAALVTWSEWAKRSLATDYGIDERRIHVIAPGAAPTYFELGEQHVSMPQRVTGPVRLLFVGGNFARKGGPLLLEAMRGPLGERCELDVVTQDRVAEQRNVRVHHDVGPNSPQLRRLFGEADVFVLPTYADCLAMVLMEATAAGLPVVTTNVGALDEAFVDGVSGLAVPPGDVAGLSAALMALVNDAGLRQRMGCAGHELARRKFDARRNNQAMLDLVVDVATQRKPSCRRAA